MTCGITFSINFPDRLDLVICNTYNAKNCFFQFQASHLFSIINQSTHHVFSKPLLGPPFSSSFLICFKNGRFWDPHSKFDGVKNASQNRPSGANNRNKLNSPEAPSRLWFSRNHSNYCAVGTSWLSTRHFFDGDWFICCVGCVSLCPVLYNSFITFFVLKTSLKTQTLSPPFF